ncbi:MAG: 4-hydroxy-3-methylbut-2-enyl diphosphate reductase [Caulobacteraceae bacterium]|nr:4-hydroxy-3-methylbut-2-enyl diphosphate reductase [Caulobacteraceae bacterium]
MELRLANPRGFCAGVERAIMVVDELLELTDGPVFVRHEIVHNRIVVDELRRKGAVFVETIDEIPPGAVAVVSAHGAPSKVGAEAKARGLRLFDATCPLVVKVQLEVLRHARQGRAVIVVGHKSHPEVIGLVGHYDREAGPGVLVVESEADAGSVDPPIVERLGYVTQTTLSFDETDRIVEILKRRFPAIIGPRTSDICYATQNRQQAVVALAADCDLILVIGAAHSSNSMRLRETAERLGSVARLIETADDIAPGWLVGRRRVGLTASASAPEHLVAGVVERLRRLLPGLAVVELGEPEHMVFRPPPELRALRLANRPERPAIPRPPTKRGSVMDNQKPAEAVGMEEVVRSVRELARGARGLVEQAGGVAEREVAMILTVSEQARDRLVSSKGLEQGRRHPLFGALRADAHRAVDLGFDAVSIAYVTAVDVVENFLDQSRGSTAKLGPSAA